MPHSKSLADLGFAIFYDFLRLDSMVNGRGHMSWAAAVFPASLGLSAPSVHGPWRGAPTRAPLCPPL